MVVGKIIIIIFLKEKIQCTLSLKFIKKILIKSKVLKKKN